MSLSQKVNAVNAMISGITLDPAEALGIAESLRIIYTEELKRVIVNNPAKGEKDESTASATVASAG